MSYISFLENNRPLFFVHIPKCGGMSVQRWYKTVFDKKVIIIPHAPVKQLEPNNFIKWTIVRNPYDRFKSWYKFRGQILRKYSSPRYLSELEDWKNGPDEWIKKWFIAPWHDHNTLNMSGPLSNNSFFLSTPQVEWLKYKGKIKVDYILKLENLEEDFIKIKDLVNTDINLNIENKSKIDIDFKLSKFVKKKIQQVYREDFKILGYNK